MQGKHDHVPGKNAHLSSTQELSLNLLCLDGDSRHSSEIGKGLCVSEVLSK